MPNIGTIDATIEGGLFLAQSLFLADFSSSLAEGLGWREGHPGSVAAWELSPHGQSRPIFGILPPISALRNSHGSISVVVGGFDALLGAGVAAGLACGRRLCVLATGVDAGELEAVVVRERPQVVVMGGLVDYGVIVGVRSIHSVLGVVVVADSLSPLFGSVLVGAGVGCLDSSVSLRQLLAAIRSAANGGVSAGGSVPARRLGEGLLTAREIEVFEYLRRGLTYPRIGQALHITPETVRSHAASIRRKLKVAGKQELIGLSLDEVSGIT